MKASSQIKRPEIETAEKKVSYLPVIIAFILPVFLYLQTVGFGFTRFDDNLIISDNIGFLSEIRNVPRVFKTDAFLTKLSSFYRPLQTVSYMTDIQLSGGNKTWMYHLSNVLLFGLIGVVLFLLLRKFLIPQRLALLGTLIYCAHPLFISSVAWLPARGDLLLTLFSLLSFIFFIDFLKTKKNIFLVLNWFTFTVALFCKETATFLPLLFILYFFMFHPGKKFEKKYLISIMLYFVSGIIWFRMRSGAIGNLSGSRDTFGLASLVTNLPTIPQSLAGFFLPLHIAPIPGFSVIESLAGLGIVSLLLAIFIRGRGDRTKKELLFCLIWFLILLVPTMLFKTRQIDYLSHRFFLPLIGIMLFLLFVFPKKWFQTGDIKNLWPMITVLIILGFYTFIKSRAYADPMSFYNEAVSMNKHSALAFNNRGFIKSTRNNYTGALNDFNMAIALDPVYEQAFDNRGYVKSKTGDNSGALKDLNKAISLDETFANPYYHRGILYLRTGNFKEALSDMNRFISMRPNIADGYNYKGIAIASMGNIHEALACFNKAIDLNPGLAGAYGNRALARYSLKDIKGAIADCDEVLRLKPDDVKTRALKARFQQELIKGEISKNKNH